MACSEELSRLGAFRVADSAHSAGCFHGVRAGGAATRASCVGLGGASRMRAGCGPAKLSLNAGDSWLLSLLRESPACLAA